MLPPGLVDPLACQSSPLSVLLMSYHWSKAIPSNASEKSSALLSNPRAVFSLYRQERPLPFFLSLSFSESSFSPISAVFRLHDRLCCRCYPSKWFLFSLSVWISKRDNQSKSANITERFQLTLIGSFSVNCCNYNKNGLLQKFSTELQVN